MFQHEGHLSNNGAGTWQQVASYPWHSSTIVLAVVVVVVVVVVVAAVGAIVVYSSIVASSRSGRVLVLP